MTDGNVEEEVVVIGTDIKAPRVVAFAKVTGQELNARDLDAAVDADGDGTPTNDFTALFGGPEANADYRLTVNRLQISSNWSSRQPSPSPETPPH